jgi:hypothetical protein
MSSTQIVLVVLIVLVVTAAVPAVWVAARRRALHSTTPEYARPPARRHGHTAVEREPREHGSRRAPLTPPAGHHPDGGRWPDDGGTRRNGVMRTGTLHRT